MGKKKLLAFGVAYAISVASMGGINTYADVVDYSVTVSSASEGTDKIAITPYFIAISSTDNDLILNSGGKLTCASSTEVQKGYQAGVTMELQKNESNSWKTTKTWDDTSQTGFISLSKDWYVEKGTYRLKLTHTAKNSSGTVIETFTNYSVTVEYK